MEESVLPMQVSSCEEAGVSCCTTPAAVPKFSPSEVILAFHGSLLYEGIILECQFEAAEDEYAYFIHYKGWNKNRDEWVSERLILKCNAENFGLQQALKIEAEVNDEEKPRKSKKPKSKKKEKLVATEESTTSRHKPWPSHVESERRFQTKQVIKIAIPERLKQVLFNDWHLVARKLKVAILPARKSIEQIFQTFLVVKDEDKEQRRIAFCDVLRKGFKSLCWAKLLYNQNERDQFVKIREEIKKQEVGDGTEKKMQLKLTDYYGAAHLMRMFTELGSSLAQTDMSHESVADFQKTCDQFFKFLNRQFDELVFEEDYQPVDADG